jgi:hypothetical protein
VAGRIRSIENIHLIETQTRDLPASSIVPQPTTLPHAPNMVSTTVKILWNKMMHKNFVLHYILLKIIFKFMHADRKFTEVQKSIANTK